MLNLSKTIIISKLHTAHNINWDFFFENGIKFERMNQWPQTSAEFDSRIIKIIEFKSQLHFKRDREAEIILESDANDFHHNLQINNR